MAKQTVNLGTTPNDRTGDKLRVAFDKINDNFDELYAGVDGGSATKLENETWEVSLTSDGSLQGKQSDSGKWVIIQRENGDTILLSEHGSMILCADDGPEWEFTSDGTLRIPTGAKIIYRQNDGDFPAGDSFIEDSEGFRMSSANGVELTAVDMTNPESPVYRRFKFNPNGTVTFPAIEGPNWTGNGPAMVFSYDDSIAIIATENGNTEHFYADPLYIASGDGYAYGEGAEAALVAGDGGTREENFGGHFVITCTVLGDPNNQVSITLSDFQESSNQINTSTFVSFAGHVFRITAFDVQGDFVVLTLDDAVANYFEGPVAGEFSDAYPEAFAGNGGQVCLEGGDGITGGGVNIRGGRSVSSDEIPWCGGTVQIEGGNSSHGTGGHVVLKAGQNDDNTLGRHGNIKIETVRGRVTIGAELANEITAPSHFHFAPDTEFMDLIFGDDYNHLRLPSGGGVEIKSGGAEGVDGFIWDFAQDGTTTFPGKTIQPTSEPTIGPYPGHGPVTALSVTNSPNVNWLNGVQANVGDITFYIGVTDGAATITSIAAGGFDHYVGETFSISGEAFGGVTPADDMFFVVDAVDTTTSQIDLTKTIHSLDVGYYSLTDGVEGQIIHFVSIGNSGNSNNVVISVGNQRVSGNAYQDVWWIPFYGGDQGVVTAIFTNGCWQFSAGVWD